MAHAEPPAFFSLLIFSSKSAMRASVAVRFPWSRSLFTTVEETDAAAQAASRCVVGALWQTRPNDPLDAPDEALVTQAAPNCATRLEIV